jgi:hypothetical protein
MQLLLTLLGGIGVMSLPLIGAEARVPDEQNRPVKPGSGLIGRTLLRGKPITRLADPAGLVRLAGYGTPNQVE